MLPVLDNTLFSSRPLLNILILWHSKTVVFYTWRKMMTVESGKEFSEILICFPNWLMSWLSNLPLWVQLYKSSPRTESHVHLVLTSECFSRLKTVCSAENRLPKKAEEPYLCLCQIGEKWPRQVQTRAFLQPAKAPAMSTAPCAKTCPPPLSHLFPSTKPIFKVDWANW